jgi:hypothetical protein
MDAKHSFKATDEEYRQLKLRAPMKHEEFLHDQAQDEALTAEVWKHATQGDNFRMDTSMVDTVPLIIWLVYFALMMNFCVFGQIFRCCQRIQQRQSYKLRVHGVNPQSPLKE